jgi:hypothetical protein
MPRSVLAGNTETRGRRGIIIQSCMRRDEEQWASVHRVVGALTRWAVARAVNQQATFSPSKTLTACFPRLIHCHPLGSLALSRLCLSRLLACRKSRQRQTRI